MWLLFNMYIHTCTRMYICTLYNAYYVTIQNAVDDVRMVLVGNKIDLENQRAVSERRGRKVNNCTYIIVTS